MCHGFGDHSSGFQSSFSLILAQLGWVVLTVDYVGHGRSDGLHALIPSVDDLAVDVLDFLTACLDEHREEGGGGYDLRGKKVPAYLPAYLSIYLPVYLST